MKMKMKLKLKCVDSKQNASISTILSLMLFFACTDFLIPDIRIKIVYIVEFVIILIYIRQDFTFRIKKTNIWVVLWFASYFLSVGHIVSIQDFTRVLFGQCVLFVISYLVYAISSDTGKGEYYISVFAKSALCIASIGIVQVILFYTVGSTWGISHQNSIYGLARPRSFTAEPDWYGLVCGIATIYYFISYCENRSALNRKKDLKAVLISTFGLAISFTRAAWLSTTIAILVYLVFGRANTNKKIKIISYIVAIGMVLITIVFIVSPDVYSKILKRASVINGTKTSYDGGAWISRMYSLNIAMYYIKQHPYTGNGAGGLRYITGTLSILNKFGIERLDMVNNGSGNANIIITNIFDVGIFGTLFLVTYFVIIIFKLIRKYRYSNNTLCIINALWILLCFIDYQFNNGLRQPYLWIMFGFADYLLDKKHVEDYNAQN